MNRLYPKSRPVLVSLLLFLSLFFVNRLTAQQTHISYFTPQAASTGATVSIHGSGFTSSTRWSVRD